jgi:hypothetical protein
LRRFRVYLFDVDGTLVDSAADSFYIGRHLLDLFQELLPELTREQMDLMIADYRRIYLARHHSSTRAYAGVAEALGANPEDCLLVGDAPADMEKNGDTCTCPQVSRLQPTPNIHRGQVQVSPFFFTLTHPNSTDRYKSPYPTRHEFPAFAILEFRLML